MPISLANTFFGISGLEAIKAAPFTWAGSTSIALRRRSSSKHHVVHVPVCEASSQDGRESSTSTSVVTSEERSEADRIVDGMTFSELCDEFQCISSPAVEATARQLARDILEIREGNRALGTFALSVKYKDPLRSFTGRNKYKRPSWIRAALENPAVAVREMEMKSTSVLNMKWVVRGRPKLAGSGDLVLIVNDTFTLNQISGQVVEHVEEWDLSESSPIAQAYFWMSRLSYSTVENSKDAIEGMKDLKQLQKPRDEEKQNYYPDPMGDPTKFFQIDDNPQRDLYQIGFFIALVYLVVQFLKATL